MVVTRTQWKWFFLVLVISSSLITSCTVDTDAPGANQGCSPTSAEIADFHTNVFRAEVSGQCASCHATTASTNSSYKFTDVQDSDTDTMKKANLCYHESFGARLFDYPTSSAHPGGNFTGSLDALGAWVNSP